MCMYMHASMCVCVCVGGCARPNAVDYYFMFFDAFELAMEKYKYCKRKQYECERIPAKVMYKYKI